MYLLFEKHSWNNMYKTNVHWKLHRSTWLNTHKTLIKHGKYWQTSLANFAAKWQKILPPPMVFPHLGRFFRFRSTFYHRSPGRLHQDLGGDYNSIPKRLNVCNLCVIFVFSYNLMIYHRVWLLCQENPPKKTEGVRYTNDIEGHIKTSRNIKHFPHKNVFMIIFMGFLQCPFSWEFLSSCCAVDCRLNRMIAKAPVDVACQVPHNCMSTSTSTDEVSAPQPTYFPSTEQGIPGLFLCFCLFGSCHFFHLSLTSKKHLKCVIKWYGINIRRHNLLDWSGGASTCASEVAASATFGLFQFVKVHGSRSFAEQKSKLDSQKCGRKSDHLIQLVRAIFFCNWMMIHLTATSSSPRVLQYYNNSNM